MTERRGLRGWLVPVVAIALLANAGAGEAAGAAAGPVVRTAGGLIEGMRDRTVERFLGIPYAASPVGERRWRVPAPAVAWTAPRSARGFAANCVQPALATDRDGAMGPWTREYNAGGPTSEDCLYLNVWRPAQRGRTARPILFWIHGGAFVSSSGSVPIYDGTTFARHGLIVVTINYRLGVLGFLAHPDLSAELGVGASGDYALQDQLAALRWVRANAATLGGDHDRITIAGQSAGAASATR